MPPRPNILLITCDQLRAFETGCYGNPLICTPHLDALAAGGVRFETTVTNFPVCMAARSVLISGQYNRTCTGGVGNVAFASRPGDFNMPEYPERGRPHLPDPTLPEILRNAGYHTRVIGKWHIHSWPHEVGFDDYLIPRVHHCHSSQSFTHNGGPEFVPGGYSVDFEASEAASFLASRRRAEQPFFLYYNISPPHCPLADAPEQYLRMYDPREIPLRPNVDTGKPLDRQDYWLRVYRYDFRYYNLHLPYTESLPAGYNLRTLIAEYYGLTTWMDTALGRVLAALDTAGLADDTVVMFTSDHGDNLGSHGLVQKGGPTEESVRIPYILRWPRGFSGGRVCSAQVASLVDAAPTLLSLAGLESPAHMPGADLVPIIRGERSALDVNHGIIETGAGAAVRTPELLAYLPYASPRVLADAPAMLFDMACDPFQLANLADAQSLPADADAGLATLRQWDKVTPWIAQHPV
ncbi:MAG: sulfatase-like hydrolase/transferase [Chloroflexi bacterium]|nr:sulfatase-like hydrolase/transferase [Chloroflexota bacterium]